MTNWVKLIKTIAKEERMASKPCNIAYGTVKTVKPLSIALNQQLILDSDFLILPNHLKKQEVKMEIDGIEKIIKIDFSLKEKEKVLMVRAEGGQKYAVVGKIQ